MHYLHVFRCSPTRKALYKYTRQNMLGVTGIFSSLVERKVMKYMYL